jgi:hypothetical protein
LFTFILNVADPGPVPFWPRDPGWFKILKFFDADPGSVMKTLGYGTRDGKKSDPGSGINIPNPLTLIILYIFFSWTSAGRWCGPWLRLTWRGGDRATGSNSFVFYAQCQSPWFWSRIPGRLLLVISLCQRRKNKYIHTWDTWWLVSASRHSCWFLSVKYRFPPGSDFFFALFVFCSLVIFFCLALYLLINELLNRILSLFSQFCLWIQHISNLKILEQLLKVLLQLFSTLAFFLTWPSFLQIR